MENLKNQTFPVWAPLSLVEQVTSNCSSLPSKESMDLRSRRMAEEERIKFRLLTDPRMENIWSLFTTKYLEDKDLLQYLNSFVTFLLVAQLDGSERSLEEVQKAKSKQLKRTFDRQVRNLIGTIREIDEWSSGPETMKLVERSIMDGEQSYEKQILRIQNAVGDDIGNYNASANPRIFTFIYLEEKKLLLNLKKRGSGDYTERFIAAVATIFFKRWFGNAHSSRAFDVALVVLGKQSEHYISKKHKKDRVRKNSNRLRKTK